MLKRSPILESTKVITEMGDARWLDSGEDYFGFGGGGGGGGLGGVVAREGQGEGSRLRDGEDGGTSGTWWHKVC